MPDKTTAVKASQIPLRDAARRVGEYAASLGFVLPPEFNWNDRSASEVLPLFYANGKFVNPMTFFIREGVKNLENIVTQGSSDRVGVRNSEFRGSLRDQIISDQRALEGSEFALLVNPAEIDTNITKNFGEHYVRGGWTIAHNHTNPPVFSAQGQTAGFYAGDSEGSGITRTRRAWSGAYNNLMDLVAFFKNNATIRNPLDRGVIDKVLSVMIHYDGWIYEGNFRSLSVEESADRPFILNYSFEFLVHRFTHAAWVQVSEQAPDVNQSRSLQQNRFPNVLTTNLQVTKDPRDLRESEPPTPLNQSIDFRTAK